MCATSKPTTRTGVNIWRGQKSKKPEKRSFLTTQTEKKREPSFRQLDCGRKKGEKKPHGKQSDRRREKDAAQTREPPPTATFLAASVGRGKRKEVDNGDNER
jgi:hypothetical protein